MISVRRLGLKDLKRDGVKVAQLKLKATAEEPKKINEAKNGRFEVESLENRGFATRQRKRLSAKTGCPMDNACPSNENRFKRSC